MNQKEISELRRRFRADRAAVSRIYGCYVNGNREIISYVDESLGNMPQEEAEQYLNLLKKSMSGALGKNLIDVVFSTEQVMDSDEHRLLSALRESELKDGEVREEFYRKIIGALDMDGGNYLILLAHDSYDVPRRGRDGAAQDSETVFSYILCSICPVKDGKLELGYFPGDNGFHNCTAGQVVSPPEAGFLFPAFDDRAANIYNALYYARKPDTPHFELLDALFRTEPPMTSAEQKEAFQSALTEALEGACSLDVAQAVHDQLHAKIQTYQESKDPESLEITGKELGDVLRDCGVPEERAAAFQEKCAERFGGAAVMNPLVLTDAKKFEIKTGDVTISMDPACSYAVTARVIDGRKYLLIPAGEGVEVNGLPVEIREEEAADSPPTEE
ncbi:MAG: DUF4317 domain-containing protein [Oscillibacter sp.]|nr:DUF4317 domain-containing protein [Oscillibacter sp.]